MNASQLHDFFYFLQTFVALGYYKANSLYMCHKTIVFHTTKFTCDLIIT